MSFKSVKHFISYSKKYIYISTSYIHHFLSPEKYPINASVGNKKILYKYAKDKYKIECLVKENSANSHILRTVPLISNIDHTERTKNFIKLLGNKDVYSIISNKFIQINSANLFSDMIIKRLNINKSSVIDIAGCNISIKKIFEKLNIVFNDQQSSNDHNDIPFLDFNCTFPGNRISENHIIKIFQDIDRSILE